MAGLPGNNGKWLPPGGISSTKSPKPGSPRMFVSEDDIPSQPLGSKRLWPSETMEPKQLRFGGKPAILWAIILFCTVRIPIPEFLRPLPVIETEKDSL